MRKQTVNQSVTGVLELFGHRFPFHLELQRIKLGAAGPVDYYYIPPSALRGQYSDESATNFRTILSIYKCLPRYVEVADKQLHLQQYLLALCYPLLRSDRAVQHIYRDAFLRPSSFCPEALKLPEEDQKRIRPIVLSREKEAVRLELRSTFGAEELSREDELYCSVAMNHWLGVGVERSQQEGHDGTKAWLRDVRYWYKRYRRKGSDPRLKLFLKVIAYEAKAAFYHAYTNFWIALIPWLKAHRNINATTTRFLQLWHFQNQRAEVSYEPRVDHRQRVAASDGVDKDNCQLQARLGGRIVDGGAIEVVPDVFHGQVLSLHPLSWILLARPELRELVGMCISSDRFEERMTVGRVDDFTEYWGLVEAILTASKLYRLAHAGLESRRPFRASEAPESGVVEVTGEPADGRSGEGLLGEFISKHSPRCECGSSYQYAGLELPVAEGIVVNLRVKCESCGHTSDFEASQHDLEEFLELRHRTVPKRRPR